MSDFVEDLELCPLVLYSSSNLGLFCKKQHDSQFASSGKLQRNWATQTPPILLTSEKSFQLLSYILKNIYKRNM